MPQRIESLQKELDGDQEPDGRAWGVLARYLEADTKLPEAVRAAEKAIEIEPRSIPAWTLAARVRESAGNLGDAGRRLAPARRDRPPQPHRALDRHRQARGAAGPDRRRP